VSSLEFSLDLISAARFICRETETVKMEKRLQCRDENITESPLGSLCMYFVLQGHLWKFTGVRIVYRSAVYRLRILGLESYWNSAGRYAYDFIGSRKQHLLYVQECNKHLALPLLLLE